MPRERAGIGDFMRGQKSPIYDGRGNVIGYDHGYGRREDFNKPIPRDEYKGPGHEMPIPPRGSKPTVEYTPPRRDKPDAGIPTPPREDFNDDRVYIGGPSPIRGVSGHDYVNNPKYREHRNRQPRREIVTKPTRDLNSEYEYVKTEKERRRGGKIDPRLGIDDGPAGGGRGFPKPTTPKKDWWNEPRRGNIPPRVDSRPPRNEPRRRNIPPRVDSRPPRNDTNRWEILTGGNRLASDSERMDLLTGKRSLPGDSERMRLLTGESDFGGRGSRYGGRREYDPQDRDFNRQFDTEPSDNRIVHSQFSSSNNALQRFGDTGSTKGWPVIDNVPTRRDQRENTLRDYDKGGEVEKMYDEFRGTSTPSNQNWSGSSRSVSEFDPTKSSTWWEGDRKFKLIPEARGGIVDGQWDKDYLVSPPTITEFTPHPGDPDYDPQRQGSQAKYDDSSIKERIRNLENRPQSTGNNWDEDRIKALESRGPIVNQPTVDLSGVQGRLSKLEGKESDWQEDRIAALEGKAPSWQEDRIKQLEGGRTESKSARDLLDQRLASLENYYKNDPPPPPEESTGNRYEDKQAALNKMWEQTGNVYDPEAFAKNNPWQKTKDDPTPSWFSDERKAANDYVRNKDYHGEGWQAEQNWASRLPDTYRKQMRDLDKEYNKPSHSAIIKGREYTAYGPSAAARLKYLDQENIHEDEYLGHGTWQNKFGEEVTGRGRAGSEKRYFASHSGLDPEGEEYAKRFRRQGFTEGPDNTLTNYQKKKQAGTLSDWEKSWYPTSQYANPEVSGKYGWGVVGTNRSKTGQTKWDEAYYPELG